MIDTKKVIVSIFKGRGDSTRVHVRLTHKPTGISVEGDGDTYGEIKDKLNAELEEAVEGHPGDVDGAPDA